MYFKFIILLFTTAIAGCQPNDNTEAKIEQLSNRIEALEMNAVNQYKPGLGTLMNSIQIHHLKLWKSGINNNWDLAKFELHELEERFEDIEKYHSEHPETEQIEMIFPQIENIETATENKNKARFMSAYESLTATCNSCHQLNEHPFIKIIIPQDNNENQVL